MNRNLEFFHDPDHDPELNHNHVQEREHDRINVIGVFMVSTKSSLGRKIIRIMEEATLSGEKPFFSFTKLKKSLGASVEHIFDTNTIKPDVQVARIVDPQLSQDMFEFLLAICMNHLRGLDTFRKQQARKEWKQHGYRNINSCCISLLGAGKIGSHVAAEFARSGFKVQTWSEEPVDIQGVKSIVGSEGLLEMLGVTEILINLLPLTRRTRGLLDKNFLGQLKQGAYLINAGRGSHLVEEDLLELLKTGQLSGAALDVFDDEPLPSNHVFWDHPGISITPHVASLTNINTAVDQIVDNYMRLKNGEALINQVSREKGY